VPEIHRVRSTEPPAALVSMSDPRRRGADLLSGGATEVPNACEHSQARARDAVLTLGDRMFPTVGEEENAFLRTQRPRLFAVEMRGRILLEHEGVIRQDHASAVRADQWLFHR
jgi:hypothetical protein